MRLELWEMLPFMTRDLPMNKTGRISLEHSLGFLPGILEIGRLDVPSVARSWACWAGAYVRPAQRR